MAVVATSAQAFVSTPSSVQLRSLAAASTSSAAASTTAAAAGSGRRSNRRARVASTGAPGPLRASAEAATYELDEKPLRGPLTPIEDTVMVKVDLPETVTEAGLFLPKMKSAKITRGTVTAVGEGKRHWDTGVQIPITVEVGDRVVYGNYDGTSVEYQGAQHLLMRDTELLMAYQGDEVRGRVGCPVVERVACARGRLGVTGETILASVYRLVCLRALCAARFGNAYHPAVHVADGCTREAPAWVCACSN